MKFERNKKYTTISIYVIVVAVILMILFQALDNIASINDLLGRFVEIMSPFLFGIIFAYILHPVLEYFEKKAIPTITNYKLSRRTYRYLSIFITILIAFSAIGFLIYFILPEILNNVTKIITEYAPNVKSFLSELFFRFNMQDSLVPLISTITTTLQDLFSQALVIISKSIESVIAVTSAITTAIINFFVGIFVAVYLWASKEKYIAQTKKLSYAYLPKKFVDKMLEILNEANDIFSGFVSGKIIDSIIVGILCYIGMLVLDLPYALLISVVIGVTNIIPYLGPFIGAIPSIILLLIIDPIEAIWFAIFIIILQQIDGNIIAPKILGVSTGLSALWVIFSVSFFGGIFGFVGMVIGVPLFALIYSLLRKSINSRLKDKNLSVNTECYTTDDNKIIQRGEKISRGKKK